MFNTKKNILPILLTLPLTLVLLSFGALAAETVPTDTDMPPAQGQMSPEKPVIPEESVVPEEPAAPALPWVEGTVIYANGVPLLVAAQDEGTTVYVDVNANGILDAGDKSLASLGISGAPEDGTDLSGYTVNAVGISGAANATVTVLSGVIGGVDYGEPPEGVPELPKNEDVFFEEPEPEPEPPEYYLNVLAVCGGAIYVDYSRAAAGVELMMLLTPEDGNVLDELIVTGPDGEALELTEQPDGSYRFVMPEGDVCLTVRYCKSI